MSVVDSVLVRPLEWVASKRKELRKPKLNERFLPDVVPRIVVMPFDDFSPSEDNQDFALAISESVVTRLASVEGLKIISRTSVMRSPASSMEVGELLAADYVVQGSVVKSGESCRVAVQLVRTDETHVWAEAFDFEWSDIFKVQDEVSVSIAQKLRATAEPARAAPPPSVAAYETFLKGRYNLVQYVNFRRETDFLEAQRRFLHAVELDPGYADAFAELGHLHYRSLYPPTKEREDVLASAKGYLDRALEIDPEHVASLYLLGSVHAQSGRVEQGLELCRKAVQLVPDDATAHAFLGERYAEMGFYEAALVEFDESIARDPLYPYASTWRVRYGGFIGRWDESLDTAYRLRELFPNSPLGELVLGETFYRMGKLDDAESIWRAAHQNPAASTNTSYFEIALALVATRRGDVDEGRRVLKKFEDSPRRYQSNFIEIAALVGDAKTVVARIDGHPYFMN